jgi:hypothetical protein
LSSFLRQGSTPIKLWGLGILNLEKLGWALKIWWLWAEKMDQPRPWDGFQVEVPRNAKALFNMAAILIIGNGKRILFWKDRWLDGKNIAELAPNLFSTIGKRTVKKRTVADSLSNRRWVSDIKGALTIQVLEEYLMIWDQVGRINLQPEILDTFRWKLTQTGDYSSKSAYTALFTGSIHYALWKKIWKSWAPLGCRFFIWMVFKKKRCWTADKLAKRGLPHPNAWPLCEQEEETIQHLLVGCAFSRQLWFYIFHPGSKTYRAGT